MGLCVLQGREVLDGLQGLGFFGCDLVKETDKLLDGIVQEDCVDDPSISLDVLDRAAASGALGERPLDVKVDLLLSDPLSRLRHLVKVGETCDTIKTAHREDVATRKQDQRIFIRVHVLERREHDNVHLLLQNTVRGTKAAVLTWRALLATDRGALMTTIEESVATLITGQSFARASTRQGAGIALWLLGMCFVGASPRASVGAEGTRISAILATSRVLAPGGTH